jgi:flagellar hook-basal body complex protein FliE
MTPLLAIRHDHPALTRPELQPGSFPEASGPTDIPAAELNDLPPLVPLQPGANPASTPSSFGSLVGQLIGEVSDQQAAAGTALNGLLTGQNVSLHQAMIAMQEASVSFQLMVEVRNKLLESYQELMRMQV